MNQLNALAQVGFMVTLFHVCVFSQVQGITSLTIGEEGNPLYAKNWRPYAIFRSPNSVKWWSPPSQAWALGTALCEQPRGEILLHLEGIDKNEIRSFFTWEVLTKTRSGFTWNKLTKTRSCCTWKKLNRSDLVALGRNWQKRDQVSDDEILAANETYGSLGELAIMALPKSQVLRIFCIGTFLSGPFLWDVLSAFFGTFWGPFIT